MPHALRSLVGLLSLIALQLSLLGPGIGCPLMGASSDSSMATMGMTGGEARTSTDVHDCGESSHESRQPQSDAPHCDNMMVCAFAIVSPHRASLDAAAVPPADVDGRRLPPPVSFARAPEPPPPRA